VLHRISLFFLLLFALTANAITFSDIKVGYRQIGDSQWDVNACMNTTTCNVGSESVGNIRGGWGFGSQRATMSAGQYIMYTASGDSTLPWNAILYNSNGTVNKVLGKFRILIAGSQYAFITNDPVNAGNGHLISFQSTLTGGAVSFTGTHAPTAAQMDAYSSSYSPNPLAAGATYTPPAPPPPQYSSGITTTQQASKTAHTTARQSQTANEIYIEQVGDNNSITIRQGTSSAGKNRMTVNATGNSNTLNLNQGYNTDGTVSAGDGNNHYLLLTTSGNSNNITTSQTGNGQYNETTVTGNSNVINLQQMGTGSKTLFTNVNGSNNTAIVQQKDSGQDYLDLKLTGNGHNVNALQQGSGNHAATIDLTNAGGASTVNMTQQGSTAQTYSIQQSCATPTGCSTTIVQGQ
jgi:hypothetical protein